MKVGRFECVNESKLNRAIHGTTGQGGVPQGGVGEGAEENAILAAYDKLGGLILCDGREVKYGSFWDVQKKQPREKPEVMLVFKDLQGRKVELPLGKEVPMEIQAAEKIIKEDKEKKLEKVKKFEEKKAKVAEEKKLKKIKKEIE